MEVVEFALLGLATGGIYTVLAQGLVLIYRGSGLLNFAQGAVAMSGAYIYFELTAKAGVALLPAAIAAVMACATLGAAIHYLVLKPMRASSPLARLIATLALLLILQSGAFILFGDDTLSVPSLLPTRTVHLFSHSLPIGEDRILIIAIAVALTVGLDAVSRRTGFGRLTAAVAEDETVAASLGHGPDLIAGANWAIGSALAGLAGVLIAPITFLEPNTLVLLVVPALAAGLLSRFSSFWLTLAMAMLIGVAESEITLKVSAPGWPVAAPFIAILVLLLVRGSNVPLRSFVLDRLPAVGSGRLRPIPIAVAVAGSSIAVSVSGATWAVALTTTFAIAIVCLSVVVVTGYSGQLSLAQYVLAGVGALIAAKLAPHMTFAVAVGVAVAATAAIGAGFAIPAVRTRGITLAIVTLGLGSAVYAVVLDNFGYTGGATGIAVPVPHLFGWNIDPFAHADRYAFVTLAVLAILCIAVLNLRRGVIGRRLLAVRGNERAAAAAGVNVPFTKLYAFTLAGAIAAVGGILLAFVQPTIEVGNFDIFASVLVTAVAVVGGIGAVGGALIGSLLIAGGVLSQLFASWPQVNNYLPLVSAVLLLLTLRAQPDGVVFALRGLNLRDRLRRRSRPADDHLAGAAALRQTIDPAAVNASHGAPRRAVVAGALVVDDVSVSYGGVSAVRGLSIEVRQGEVHGLIGPNGAGKTSLIDAITGFADIKGGRLSLGGVDITALPPRRRALAGLGRSFQSLELFDELTVGENLALVCERPSASRYVTDLVYPQPPVLYDAARDAVEQLELGTLTERTPTELPFGTRKRVAIARAIASEPSIVLLDEPAAGLDDHAVAELGRMISDLARHRGIGVLLVEHKIDLVMSISDRVSVMVEGEILTSGTPEEVRSDPRVMEAYLGKPTVEPPTAARVPEFG